MRKRKSTLHAVMKTKDEFEAADRSFHRVSFGGNTLIYL